MTALAKEKKLSPSEEALKDCILDNIIEDFCKDCPGLRYEFDTGSWYCPCGDDPDEPECYRGSEWNIIREEADNFISNIRSCWQF